MSPDRTTITRAEAVRRRREDEQKRREQLTQRAVAKPKLVPQSSARQKTNWPEPAQNSSTVSGPRLRRNYGMTLNAPYRQTPRINTNFLSGMGLNMPHISYGPRWLSFILASVCLAVLYMMLNVQPFVAGDATIIGNKRVSVQEIQDVLAIKGQPIITLDPTMVENRILASFQDISSAHVDLSISQGISVTIQERIPVAAWQQQSGETFWLDADGYKFAARGQVDSLPVIISYGDPPAIPVPVDDKKTTPEVARFIPEVLSQSIGKLSQYMPTGASLIFDPQYGIGWLDPSGLKVYFGQSFDGSSTKIKVYQALLDHLATAEIQPVMISVEYPNAPFYRIEQ